jgi:hypothetical protein
MLFATDPLRLTQGKGALINLGAFRTRRCEAGRSWILSASLVHGLNEGDGTLLEVGHELRRNPGLRQRILFEAPVQRPHGIDVLLPDGEQELDVTSFSHRFT